MRGSSALRDAVVQNGYAVVEDVLPETTVLDLRVALKDVGASPAVRQRGGIFAVRNLLDVSSEVRTLARSEVVRGLVEPVLGTSCFPVRGIFFDKVPGANWTVPWHQDVTIAVQDRVEAEGYGPWSVKAEVLHVQPPAEVLQAMLSVRLHLDNCGEENGALRVLPGTHAGGRIPEAQIAAVKKAEEVVCVVRAGGAVLMRPLLLHASSPAQVPGHRRVVHLDFAAVELPEGMRWAGERAKQGVCDVEARAVLKA